MAVRTRFVGGCSGDVEGNTAFSSPFALEYSDGVFTAMLRVNLQVPVVNPHARAGIAKFRNTLLVTVQLKFPTCLGLFLWETRVDVLVPRVCVFLVNLFGNRSEESRRSRDDRRTG